MGRPFTSRGSSGAGSRHGLTATMPCCFWACQKSIACHCQVKFTGRYERWKKNIFRITILIILTTHSGYLHFVVAGESLDRAPIAPHIRPQQTPAKPFIRTTSSSSALPCQRSRASNSRSLWRHRPVRSSMIVAPCRLQKGICSGKT